VTYRTLLFDDELGFQFGNPRFECGDHVADRPVTARWPRGQGLVLDLLEVDGGQSLVVVATRARQAMALDDGTSGFGGDAEAFADLSVSKSFGSHVR